MPFWGPNNKYYSMWESILESPNFGKQPYIGFRVRLLTPERWAVTTEKEMETPFEGFGELLHMIPVYLCIYIYIYISIYRAFLQNVYA